MDQREGDVRVYIISGFFFSCIVSGGVFLGLYMFLPETLSSAWYPIAGMILVSVPWAFWFFTFLYRCFKPDHPPPQFDSSARFSKGGSSTRDPSTANGSPIAATATNAMASESPNGESPGGGSERRVQFGPVVVLGGQGEGHAGAATTRDHHEQEANEASNCSRESEMPLRLSI
ncbi:hypothetical protein L484_023849 [Morus notabilis]|uniref:Uncharacterized protein n=1 Tax=Morus notabilis TaxID=981085 RepID=W9R5B5_9ROSA|nr:uncharacterized protein LOC21406602 [Morus notabilis]EXB70663.1 hypothetical protein L484_023849 [Morus notabilis]